MDGPLGSAGPQMILVDWGTLRLRPEEQNLWQVSIAAPEDWVKAVVAGLERLSNTYPELRWSTETEARAQFHRKVWQRFALLWAAMGTMLVMGTIAMVNMFGATWYPR